jgi:hypothetical protein
MSSVQAVSGNEISSSEVTSTPTTSNWMSWDWCFVVFLIVVVPILYFPFAAHNFPVVSHVDERTSLEVLGRFHDGSLNPKFFMYPTLYYYVTYFLTIAFPFSKILFYGRLLNLAFVGLTAAITYRFCQRHLRSRPIGVIAALCVATSAMLASSASYLCTDVLLTAATLASLFFLVEFFHCHRRRDWILAMLTLGCAISCKYTAFVVYIAYFITEILYRIMNRSDEFIQDPFLSAKLSRKFIVCTLLGVAAVAVIVAVAFPVNAAINFIASTRTNPDLKSTAEYLDFFHHIRLMMAKIAVVSVIGAIVIGRFKSVYEWIALRRIYYGLGLVVVVCALSTPYSMITPRRFIYDLGALARTNIIVASSHAQWRDYISWLIQNENDLILALSVIGLVIWALGRKSQFLIVAVYLLVFSFIIGSAHVGFARYVDPMLPLIYCGAGISLMYLWNQRAKVGVVAKGITIVLCAIALMQLRTGIVAARELGRTTDSDYASYQTIVSLAPKSVVFAGVVPYVELQRAGIPTKQISWVELGQRPLSGQISCDQVLVFDKAGVVRNQIMLEQDPLVVSVFDDPRGHGQQVFKRSNCGSGK